MKIDVSGRSMIEVIGVLVIIGMLSIGGIVGYSRAMTKYRINKTINEVTRLVQGIHTLYMSQKNYSGLCDNKAQLSPNIAKFKNLFGFNARGSNVFGGKWYVFNHHPNNNSNGSNSYPLEQLSTAFVVVFTGVPEEACMTLATTDWRSSGDGLIGFGIGNSDTSRPATNIKRKDCPQGKMVSSSGGYYLCAQDMPMKPSDAVTACSTSNNNSYTFSFKYK